MNIREWVKMLVKEGHLEWSSTRWATSLFEVDLQKKEFSTTLFKIHVLNDPRIPDHLKYKGNPEDLETLDKNIIRSIISDHLKEEKEREEEEEDEELNQHIDDFLEEYKKHLIIAKQRDADDYEIYTYVPYKYGWALTREPQFDVGKNRNIDSYCNPQLERKRQEFVEKIRSDFGRSKVTKFNNSVSLTFRNMAESYSLNAPPNPQGGQALKRDIDSHVIPFSFMGTNQNFSCEGKKISSDEDNTCYPMYTVDLATLKEGEVNSWIEFAVRTSRPLDFCLAVADIATPDIQSRRATIFQGAGGLGKSTVTECLAKFFGGSMEGAPGNTTAFTFSHLPKNYLVVFSDKRDVRNIIRDDLFKNLTGGDKMYLDQKHKSGFSYNPKNKVIVHSNNTVYSSPFVYEELSRTDFFYIYSKEILPVRPKKNDISWGTRLESQIPAFLFFCFKLKEKLYRDVSADVLNDEEYFDAMRASAGTFCMNKKQQAFFQKLHQEYVFIDESSPVVAKYGTSLRLVTRPFIEAYCEAVEGKRGGKRDPNLARKIDEQKQYLDLMLTKFSALCRDTATEESLKLGVKLTTELLPCVPRRYADVMGFRVNEGAERALDLATGKIDFRAEQLAKLKEFLEDIQINVPEDYSWVGEIELQNNTFEHSLYLESEESSIMGLFEDLDDAFERPDWDKIVSGLESKQQPEEVGVSEEQADFFDDDDW